MNLQNILFSLHPKTMIQVFLLVIIFLFLTFSCFGWILEVFYRRFFSAKKWVNPGFLKGPYLPIYGIGVILLSCYSIALSCFAEYFPAKWMFHTAIAVGIGILMTLLELIAGWIFIHKMHIQLWDYSDCFGNYKGIICPRFTLIWTVLGFLFYRLLFPPVLILIIKFVSLDWFLFAIFFMGSFYGIFVMDLLQSLEVANKLKALSEENHLILRWEAFKEHIRQELEQKQIKPAYLSPFKSPFQLQEHLKTFLVEQHQKFHSFHKKE